MHGCESRHPAKLWPIRICILDAPACSWRLTSLLSRGSALGERGGDQLTHHLWKPAQLPGTLRLDIAAGRGDRLHSVNGRSQAMVGPMGCRDRVSGCPRRLGRRPARRCAGRRMRRDGRLHRHANGHLAAAPRSPGVDRLPRPVVGAGQLEEMQHMLRTVGRPDCQESMLLSVQWTTTMHRHKPPIPHGALRSPNHESSPPLDSIARSRNTGLKKVKKNRSLTAVFRCHGRSGRSGCRR